MPKIPVYEAQQGLSPALIDPRAAAAPGIALAQFGATGAAYAVQALERQKNADNAAWVAKTVSQTRSDWTQRWVTASEEADAGAPDFTKTIADQFDNDLTPLLDTAPSPEARAAAEERLGLFREDLVSKSLVFESKARVAKRKSDLLDSINLTAAAVRGDPESFAAAITDTEDFINAADLPADERSETLRLGKAQIAEAALSALIDSDPARAKRELVGGAWAAYLDTGRAEQFINGADNEINRRRAEAERRANEQRIIDRAELAADWDDTVAAIEDGSEAQLLSPVTEDRLVKVLGEKDGKAQWQTLQDLRGLQADKTLLALAPAETQDQIIAGYKPEGQGYAAEAGARDKLMQTALTLRRELAEDPAEYARRYVPVVASAFARAQQSRDPVDFVTAIDLSLQAQRELGVAEKDLRPLTKTAATDWVANWQSQGDGPQRYAALEDLTTRLPNQAVAGRVLAQLTEAGLPREAAIALDAGRDEGRRNQAVRVLGELTVAEFPKLETADEDKVKTAAREAFFEDGIGSVLSLQQAMTGNAAYGARATAQYDALLKVGKQRRFAGADAGDAVEAAYADLYGGQSFIADEDLAAVFFPAGTDEDLVEKGLTRLRDKTIGAIDAGGIAEASRIPNTPELPFIDEWISSLPDRLRWIDDRGEQVYTLIDVSTGRALQLGGKPVTARLADVLAEGSKPTATIYKQGEGFVEEVIEP
jgi:hypothetical protein